MNIEMYKELLEQLKDDGIKIEKLRILDISHSIKLYKMFKNWNLNTINVHKLIIELIQLFKNNKWTLRGLYDNR